MYDDKHVFINGESYVASGRDAQLIRALADQRFLAGKEVAKLTEGATALLRDWQDAGWLHADD
jgi:50S ribosomal protein L16 3-hydroxylase